MKQRIIITVAAVLVILLALYVVVISLISSGAASAASVDEPCVPSPASTEQVFDHWQRYSWNGPWESNTEAPPFPDDRWQANVQGDPHGVGIPGAYFRSHGNSGNGDWFYLEAVTKTVHHDAVVCEPTEQPTTETPITETPTTETPTDIGTPLVVTPTPDQPVKEGPKPKHYNHGPTPPVDHAPLPNTGA